VTADRGDAEPAVVSREQGAGTPEAPLIDGGVADSLEKFRLGLSTQNRFVRRAQRREHPGFCDWFCHGVALNKVLGGTLTVGAEQAVRKQSK
jgi:hypothetical protein